MSTGLQVGQRTASWGPLSPSIFMLVLGTKQRALRLAQLTSHLHPQLLTWLSLLSQAQRLKMLVPKLPPCCMCNWKCINYMSRWWLCWKSFVNFGKLKIVPTSQVIIIKCQDSQVWLMDTCDPCTRKWEQEGQGFKVNLEYMGSWEQPELCEILSPIKETGNGGWIGPKSTE